jgi:hypothetical protein
MRTHAATRPGARLRPFVFALSVAVALCGAGGALASGEDPPDSHRNWGVSWLVRGGGAGGGYGEFLEDAIAWDLDIYRQRGDWRFGAGLTFGSLAMKSPYEDEPEWAHFETYGLATRMFRNPESVRPYVQGRFGVVRMHPRSEVFLKKPVEELEPGESPTDAVNGVGLSVIPGVEFDIARGLAVDASAYFNTYITGDYPLAAIGREDTGDGLEWGGRVGATWRPISFEDPLQAGAPPDTTPLAPESGSRDAWGTTRSPGWAAAEVLAINFGASMFNEYVRQANFNQISPRSFWSNIEDGFNFDDNKFKTNQLIHPFNGSTYYNSSRSNGLSFWPSTVYALTGAFIWEAMGETHPMSYNDMISTGIGGIAFGEATYRLSSALLDNTATGSGRTWREIGGFLLDPVRGFNRFLSGQATRVQGNPASPYDRNPPKYYTALGVGGRMIGKGESIRDSTETQSFLDLYVNHGSPWENERRKPFDHFDVGAQFNGNDKVPLGRFQIRGDLFSNAFGGPTGDQHALALVQYFDYVNNNAYEFGAQSFGGALFSRFEPSTKLGIATRVDLLWSVLAAVNADYSFLAEVENRERFREYDYGPGAGTSVEAALSWSGRRILLMSYRAEWIDVRNGSVWNPSETGSNADHFVHTAAAKLTVPVRGPMSIGFDAAVFVRDSHYELVEVKDVYQRVPQARLYLSWDTTSR